MTADLDVIIPVYNEEAVLEASVRELHAFMTEQCPLPWRVTVYSNGSTDRTVEIGTRLAGQLPGVVFKHTDEKGKARALRRGWLESQAEYVGFMDADLATGLDALPLCVAKLIEGADFAIGCRHAPDSRVERSLERTIVSRGYNTLLRCFFPFSRIKDAACGFKFGRRKVVQALLPHVRNERWWFDSELILLAEHEGRSIAQVPVRWSEGAASKVRVAKVASEYVTSLAELRWRLWRRASS
jgi:glycosyltransferase involved in cell wall biosynthesis